MRFEIQFLRLKLKREFVVSGGRESVKHNFLVIADDVGMGEAAGSVHYGAQPDEIERDLRRLINVLIDVPDDDIGRNLEAMRRAVCAPALCAVSTAWLDGICKRRKIGLHEHFDVPYPEPAQTSVTVSVGDIDALDDYLDRGYTCLKIKMGADETQDAALMERINADARARYRIDANAGWDYDTACRVIAELPSERIELIEQPFLAEAADDWRSLREQTAIPLIMDESIATADDVRRVADYVDGVNIKIQKSGTSETAVAAMQAARSEGLQVMLGCMIESSVGTAAAFHLSGLADFLDLDGRFLIEADPFTGLYYEKDMITLSGKSGHGVSMA
jgi:L-alanine-DL-glutamate epimerase-like enolase superfamily enzyme